MKISRHQIQMLMAVGGWKTKSLAEKIGVQPNNLSTIINRGTCRPETAARIAKALGVDVTEIIKEE